jgi:hypothetical protein
MNRARVRSRPAHQALTNSISMTLTYLVVYSIMASASVAGAIRYRRLSTSARRMLMLLLVTFAVELVGYWVGRVYRTNLIIYNFFVPIQFVLFAVTYMPELSRHRRLLLGMIGASLAGGAVSLFVYRNQLTAVYPTILKTGLDALSVIIILLYLRELINRPTVHSFGQFPLFWMSIGWLLLVMLTTVGLGTFNYISTLDLNYAIVFQQVRIIAESVLYILFLVAFLAEQRQLT